MAAHVLLHLAALTGESDYEKLAEGILAVMSNTVAQQSRGCGVARRE
jgi:uncharacterized protein YyaL (SSP411 family)